MDSTISKLLSMSDKKAFVDSDTDKYVEVKLFEPQQHIYNFFKNKKMAILVHKSKVHPCYRWHLDRVYLPLPEELNKISYYHFLFHEMSHSISHPIRLNRKDIKTYYVAFSKGTIAEEITQEICVYKLFEHFDIQYSEDSAIVFRYLKHKTDKSEFQEGLKKAALWAEENLAWLGI